MEEREKSKKEKGVLVMKWREKNHRANSF